MDPVLICLHAAASAAHCAGPIHVVTVDLSEPEWTSFAAPGSVDAVVAVQVLHHFAEDRLAALLGEVRTLLRSDGVFVHLDRVPSGAPAEPTEPAVTVDPGTPTLDGDPDPWTAWWRRARELPILAEAFRDRDQRSATRTLSSAEFHPDERAWRAMLRRAGLVVVDTVRAGDSLLTCASPGC